MDWLLPEIALVPSELSPAPPPPEWPRPSSSTRSTAASSSDTLIADLLSSIDAQFTSSRHTLNRLSHPSTSVSPHPIRATRMCNSSAASHATLSPITTSEILLPRSRKPCLLFQTAVPDSSPARDTIMNDRGAPAHNTVVLNGEEDQEEEEEEEEEVVKMLANKVPREVRAIRRREFHKIHTRRSRAKLNDKMDKLLAALPAPPPGVVIKSKAQILDYAITVLSARYSHCAQHHAGHTASSS